MAFSSESYRDTWAEINTENIKYNVREIRKLHAVDVAVMAVVKADGYGHGAAATALAAAEAGASYFGVALLEEALELREAGIELPILVLGRTRPQDAPVAARNGIRLTVFQEEWLKEASKYASGESLLIHMKVDTGMGRLGLREDSEIASFLDAAAQNPSVELEGMYTHFATADELETTYFEQQYARFSRVVDLVQHLGRSPRLIHCGNSAAAMRFPEHCFNMIRFGISMYGLTPAENITEHLPFTLKEAFTLHSRLTQVKEVPPGTSISYGATYTSVENEWIGTVPIGYADGWLRAHAENQGEVLVDGYRVPIVGRICMDQMMVRLPHEVPVDTEVTLIGSQREETISVTEVASRLGTITYEVPCIISKRVPRVYPPDNRPGA
ncbi:alanine racemase [Marinococcus halophilus]|uniref:Alanine racemase n=1 Tax=Marinococcus halophilus TaxID=1371 RepID=A0A510Y3R7_MARHA|nr:alanine racemase [Marinococcus halophilus]OZT81539.1 alanine racemase [Marinococcus halophilus]GEK57481.1 alanine racemase [Marinococcus halophilus]